MQAEIKQEATYGATGKSAFLFLIGSDIARRQLSGKKRETRNKTNKKPDEGLFWGRIRC